MVYIQSLPYMALDHDDGDDDDDDDDVGSLLPGYPYPGNKLPG